MVFLPCRAGSERVPHKNTRPFGGFSQGLLGIKLAQLARVRGIAGVVLDSNDPTVLAIGRVWQQQWPEHSFLHVRERPDALGNSGTTTDALIEYALNTVSADSLLWTHVTSPLVTPARYEACLAAYDRALRSGHDSLMAVRPVRNFVWNANGPCNYARDQLKWPRTQDLSPLYEVTSAVFLAPMETARRCRDRIGDKPHLFEMSALEALDIDWEEDFAIAEAAFQRYAAL